MRMIEDTPLPIWHSQPMIQMMEQQDQGGDDDADLGDEDLDLDLGDDDGADDDGSSSDDGADDDGSDDSATLKESKNPALKAFYDRLAGTDGVIPLSLRGELFERTIKPELDKWQKGVDERFESFAPYQGLVENKVPVEAIQAGLQMLDWGRNDIGGLLKEIGEAARQKGIDPAVVLGLAVQQQQQQSDDGDDDGDDDDLIGGDLGDLSKNPIVAQMAARLKELETQTSSVFEQEQRRQNVTAIDLTVKALEKDHKGPAFNRDAIVKRAMMMERMIPEGRQITPDQLVRAAYKEWRDEAVSVIKSARRAPRLGAGGGARVPTDQQKQGPLSEDERRAKIVAMAEAMQRGENVD